MHSSDGMVNKQSITERCADEYGRRSGESQRAGARYHLEIKRRDRVPKSRSDISFLFRQKCMINLEKCLITDNFLHNLHIKQRIIAHISKEYVLTEAVLHIPGYSHPNMELSVRPELFEKGKILE